MQGHGRTISGYVSFKRAFVVALALGTAACATTPTEMASAPVVQMDEDAQVADMVSRMSLKHKVAQLIQPQINAFDAAEMRDYRWGSYLNGGNGGPYGDEFAPAGEWLRLADEMWDASTAPLPNGEPVIPTMWGTDAVHGHTNVVQATIFPHNIGLGATRDLDLVRRIGAATAKEIEVTGIDWNFSPTVAIARDDRWGRTYESYSEDPRLVAAMGAALIEGLQGRKGDDDFLGAGRVVATAKHFFGDGGTDQGVDQGDVNGDLAALRAIHAVPYPVAIDAGVETIMASFNSINGRKMHGRKDMLTDLLRGEMGFTGLVVGDWNGHSQIDGCTVSDCPQALLAGLDIYMVPDDAKALHASLMAQVADGTIPMARIDEAVSRVLRVKLRAGLLGPDARKPSARPNAGNYALLGSAEHRAIAREAVAKSQVVLKNDGVLPIRAGARVAVYGDAADDIATAAGGWTLTWQGGGELDNSDFPGATSIAQGLRQVGAERGARVQMASELGNAKPDVAIVVFGEEPYAEFVGDRKTAVFSDEEGLEQLRALRAAGIPSVAVFLSGRPMWMNREINAANAFVASWLPGGEGAGVADVLFGRVPATGKLSFSWPANCSGAPINGPSGSAFNVGYGLSLDAPGGMARLDENCGFLDVAAGPEWFANGRLGAGASARVGEADLPNLLGEAGGVVVRGLDRNRQEDARRITFGPDTAITLTGRGEGAWSIAYDIGRAPAGTVTIESGGSRFDATRGLALAAGKGWRELVLTAACLPDADGTLTIRTTAPLEMSISQVARRDLPADTQCSF